MKESVGPTTSNQASWKAELRQWAIDRLNEVQAMKDAPAEDIWNKARSVLYALQRSLDPEFAETMRRVKEEMDADDGTQGMTGAEFEAYVAELTGKGFRRE